MAKSEQISFLFYGTWRNSFARLTAEQTKTMLDAIFAFQIDGVSPEFDDPMLALMWDFIGDQFSRNAEKWAQTCERNRVNGAKGGRPRKPKKTERFLEEPKKPDNDNDHENENENDHGNVHENEAGASAPPASETTTTTSPPSVEAVESYCREHGYTIDAQHFVDYYAAKGWMVGRNPMRDWQAVVRNWARNQSPQNAPPDTGEHSYNLADFEQLMNQF